MMIYATIPSAQGIFFTPWYFVGPLLASGVITALAIAFLLWRLYQGGAVDGRGLVAVSSLYRVFAALVAGYFK
jgi:cation:H+ antiporter